MVLRFGRFRFGHRKAVLFANLAGSADGLFTRAGVVKPRVVASFGGGGGGGRKKAGGGGGGGGHHRSKSNGKRADGVGGGGNEAGAPAKTAVRRCTVKRIHVEIHRVLGEVASYREFRTALSACVRGGGGRGVWRTPPKDEASEWVG